MNHATLLAALAFVATGFVSTAANAQVYVGVAPPMVVAAGPVVVTFGAPPPVMYAPPPPQRVVYVPAPASTVVYHRPSFRDAPVYRPVVSHRPVVVYQQANGCDHRGHDHRDHRDHHADWRGDNGHCDDHRSGHGKGNKHRR